MRLWLAGMTILLLILKMSSPPACRQGRRKRGSKEMKELIYNLGTIAAIVLPFFSIPMIVKIVQRKSSKDISMTWALGVWICFILMFPSAIQSDDFNYRIFSAINLVLFTGIVIVTLKYRKQ